MKFNVGIFSSSRSDTASILPLIKLNKKLNLKIFVCGAHLDKNFGSTNYIFKDFKKNLSIHKYKTNYAKYDSVGVLKSSQRTIEKLSFFFKKNNLDGIIIIGDRYEAFIASYVALILNIKIFHLGGGETTLGSLDNKFRYSISLFSNLHFVTRLEYKYKLINYDIKKSNIFYVGDTSQEFLLKQKKYSKIELEKKFNIKLNKLNILLCYHSVTNDPKISLIEFTNIIQCLKKLSTLKYSIFITSPNHDQGADKLIKKIKKIIKLNNFFFIKNFDKYYYSILRNCIFIIGNSSSGITDAHLLKVQSINVGNRQKGRLGPKSLINVQSNKSSIMRGIKKILSNKEVKTKFPFSLKKNSSKLILKKIEKFLNNEKK
jgi:UDP-hydrolysing UDP-N-acetyl-D-glucosamine 2-epimerase